MSRCDVERLIESRIKLHWPFFRRFPEWGHDDLLQECLRGYLDSIERRPRQRQRAGKPSGGLTGYDGVSCKPTTWVCRVAECRLRDLKLVLTRRERKENAYRQDWREEVSVPDDLVEWMEESYRTCAANLVRYNVPLGGDEDGTLDAAQVTVLLAAQRRLGLGCGEMAAYCASHPAVFAALELDREPTVALFATLPNRLPKLRFNFRGPVAPVE